MDEKNIFIAKNEKIFFSYMRDAFIINIYGCKNSLRRMHEFNLNFYRYTQ